MNVRIGERRTIHATDDGIISVCGRRPLAGGEPTDEPPTCQACLRTLDVRENPRTVCPSCGGYKTQGSALCKNCRYPNRHDTAMNGTRNGAARAKDGCIITFENADQRTLTLHRQGPIKTAVTRACDEALALDDTFRVVAISTPQSIYTDLQGHRLHNTQTRTSDHTRVAIPEAATLGLCGLKHLLHPRL